VAAVAVIEAAAATVVAGKDIKNELYSAPVSPNANEVLDNSDLDGLTIVAKKAEDRENRGGGGGYGGGRDSY